MHISGGGVSWFSVIFHPDAALKRGLKRNPPRGVLCRSVPATAMRHKLQLVYSLIRHVRGYSNVQKGVCGRHVNFSTFHGTRSSDSCLEMEMHKCSRRNYGSFLEIDRSSIVFRVCAILNEKQTKKLQN